MIGINEKVDLKQNLIKKLDKQSALIDNKTGKAKKPNLNANKSRKTVQTSFFKPIVKTEKALNEKIQKVKEFLEEIDINTLTPVEAMKKMIDIKEKLSNL